ncbi:patatin-like phospholipase family protein [Acinetobacter modestus]|uniref:PNPLA domain-containing protein n=1 Tax=Acinetobacter modestus TaxID=1776740 RepID=A0ABP2TVI2_9GAMM|nr:patatin-like phospholipase family protein [Acinetobacter modestus]ENU26281.1 hypothetical protein F992_02618 [Acinetobacter modestus]MCM1957943.1 patatin-like phospholipase family protein [Acinetobacter modestus]GGA13357.1 hypothetical protein GCM10017554_06810 [Acinetobacter modestus]
MADQDLVLSIKKDVEINNMIQKIKEKIGKEPISDLEDDQGNQYVDIVLEGGGVLGIALVGYTYAMEQAGIRFLNIAGTSAGAINAMFLATLGKANEIKSDQMIKLLADMPMEDFIDAEPAFKKILFNWIEGKKPSFFSFNTLIALKKLYAKISNGEVSFNTGRPFEKWLEENIPINTTEKLSKNLENSSSLLKIRKSAKRDYIDPKTGKIFNREYDLERLAKDFSKHKLALITADITTTSKVTLPEMAELYWQNHMSLHPAKYVRASMSIPVFFEPVKVYPPKGQDQLWKDSVGYEGTIPDEATLVDGGIVSNFPIDVFHKRDAIPLCPTFGIKLGIDRQSPSKYKNLIDFAGLVFDTARQTADYNFIFQNQDYRQLIAYVDLEGNKVYRFSWLEFNMNHDKKLALFKLGVQAAYEFIVTGNPNIHLQSFDWMDYKKTREKML